MTNFPFIIFDPKYTAAFVALNTEWIEKHFRLEQMDLIQLNNPQEFILDKGGEIFFALDGDQAVGTCALLPSHGTYELAKMAVSPNYRGQGIGDILMEGAIAWAKNKGLPEIILLSNTVLEPAITLYKKHGFQTVHLGPHPDYDRCNIEMVLKLSNS